MSTTAFSLQQQSPEQVVMPVQLKQIDGKFLNKLGEGENLAIHLETIETIDYYGFVFLYFSPGILEHLTLEGFRQYHLPEMTKLNINFFDKKINGSHGIVSTFESQTFSNLQIHFESYEQNILKGQVEFDIPSLRFSFPKDSQFTRSLCIDPGMYAGVDVHGLCFTDVYVPVQIKVIMPFEILTD